MFCVMPSGPSQSGGGWWKWCALGCGGCFGVTALLVVLIAFKAGPAFKKIVAMGTKAGQDMRTLTPAMQKVQEAIVAYHTDKKSYPTKLTELVPHYLPNKSELLSPVDPAHKAFRYFEPDNNSRPSTAILEADLTIVNPMTSQTIITPVRMDLDGHMERNQGGGTVNIQSSP